MLQLPIDCIINITHFLPDKSKINLTHTNNFLHSLQDLITLTNTPVYPDTKLKFRFKQNYWFPSYPDPKSEYVIIKKPKHHTARYNGEISLPQNYYTFKVLIAEYPLKNPFPTFENLTTLRLRRTDGTPVTLPVTLRYLHIIFTKSFPLTNLHELKELRHLNINGRNLTVNLDDHPKLKSLNIFGLNANIKISKLHENLEILTHINYNSQNDIALTPNLTRLHANVIYGDLNILTRLRFLNVTKVVGPEIDLGNFKDLKDCSVFDCDCFVEKSKPCNAEILRLPYVRMVTDELFPRLLELTVSIERLNVETIINHSRVNKIILRWVRDVKFVKVDSLETLSIQGDNLDCLNKSKCNFRSLKYLDVEPQYRNLLVLNMDKMKKLRNITYKFGIVRLLGESDVLVSADVVGIDGEKEDMMKRFKNLYVRETKIRG